MKSKDKVLGTAKGWKNSTSANRQNILWGRTRQIEEISRLVLFL
jgi:hypothetical protein